MGKVGRRGEPKLRHGMSRTKTHRSWSSMLGRCLNKNDPSFKDYGGRGITICERWLVFENFLEDMGERPEGHSLDRLDTNGAYTPENCTWSTAKQQCRNRRNNRLVTYNGEEKPVTAWAEECGIEVHTLRNRLDKGWSVSDALTKPVAARRKFLRRRNT